MTYTKPEVVAVASSIETIQTQAHTKGVPVHFDTVILNDPRPTSNAYEADE